MTASNYPKATEVVVSASDAINMMNDPRLVVVLATTAKSDGNTEVTYWSKDNGPLPPWITVQQAA
ncbi:MAG TPA: hypothetical protein VF463_18185 [Sphingobium sp.]